MTYEIKRMDECCISISDGDHLPPPKSDSGVPFITISNIDTTNNTIGFSNTMFVPEAYYDALQNIKKATPGDILYSVVGTFGVPVQIKTEKKFVFQRHIAILRPNKDVVLPEYLYYVMKSGSFYAQADAFAVGSAQRTIGLSSLRKMKAAIPCVEEQEKTVTVLAAYDNLIEVNNKRIKVLEQMAENLYKEWFVRFRFPGHETAEFENGIPKEWAKRRLGEFIVFARGVSYSSADLEDGGFVLLSMNNIRPFGGFIRDYTRTYCGKFKKLQQVEPGDLIMSITDMTQDRRIIGYTGIVSPGESNRIISMHLLKLSSQEYGNVFLNYFFNCSGLSRIIAEHATGTNVLGMTEGILNRIKTVCPSKQLASEFEKEVSPIIQSINRYEQINDTLAEQRDLLLPRLMSGKLEV